MNLQEVTYEVGFHLDKILKCFKPGAKITVIVRRPDNDEADFILSDDDISEAINALERRKNQSPV